VLLGATLVFFKFPKREQERQLLARYETEDTDSAAQAPPAAAPEPVS
jgi:hypothetical protein